MFSLDNFYQMLHDNLISKFKNSHTFHFQPFGTYDDYNYIQNRHDVRLCTNIEGVLGASVICYFLDQEPLYNFTPIVGPDSTYKFRHTLHVPASRKLRIIANSEKSDFKRERLKAEQYYDWYYFFHGFAALDWYRNFQYVRPDLFDGFNKVFICYNHLISDLRSYRLHLVSNLINQDLVQHGLVSMPLQDPTGTWQNAIASPNCPLSTKAKIKIYKTLSNVNSPLIIDTDRPHGALSAEVDFNQLTSAFWHVVTETVYFLPKLHLTEKVFKPIIAQRPFILVAAPGNLAYLRSYGFKTFDRWIDESYDLEQDHYVRIEKITAEIEKLCALSKSELNAMYAEMKEVLEYNYHHFYGDFKRIIVEELVDNFEGILMQFNNGRHGAENNHSKWHHRFELCKDYYNEVKQRLLK